METFLGPLKLLPFLLRLQVIGVMEGAPMIPRSAGPGLTPLERILRGDHKSPPLPGL